MSVCNRLCLYFFGIILVSSPLVLAAGEVKHVVELFTSQGCYSCPPAEKLLGSVVDKNEDTLALEFHVDYWDTLVYGSAGKWKDPFSSASYSKRQRDYNRLKLRGRKGVYTPQMILNGRFALVGSNSSELHRHLKKRSDLSLDTSVELASDGGLFIQLQGQDDSTADVWLIIYDKKHVTDISAGENKGALLTNYNVVREFESIGKWAGQSLEITSSLKKPLEENQSCAIIVQQFDQSRQRVAGPIIGAAKCSSS